MRISDWSSDVSSSDLSTLVKSALEQYTYTSPDGAVYYFQRVHADNQKMIGAMHIRAYLMTVTRPDGDRKSVVSGTSVSVRVDLGGRRIIKTKKQSEYVV